MGGMSRRATGLLAVLGLTIGILTGAGSAGPTEHRTVRALFFGDSLIGGSGAIPHRPVQPRTTADLLGWQPVVDAYGGTGYTTGGRHGQRYLDRLKHDRYLSRSYDVIVLEGGTNDAWHGSLSRLHEAALTTIGYVRLRQPKARIVLVGGYAPHGVDLTRYRLMDAALADIADQLNLQYVSQLHFSEVTDPEFLSKDKYHPSDKGYARMGRELAAALKEG